MRLCRFEHNGAAAIGFYSEQIIVPLQAAAASLGVDVPDCDQITTFLSGGSGRVAAVALQDALEKLGVKTRVLTAIEMKDVAEPFIRRRAVRHLEKGRVVIFAGGTGSPYFTTDSCAALRGLEINADAVFKGTKVDGVYDGDPVENPNAKMYQELTYIDVLRQGLKVMDSTAISLCMDNGLAINVFNITQEGNIKRIVSGEKIGTQVKKEVND